uniref:Photosystem II protein D1 n=1 Tax=Siphoviridae sp. ctdmY20 TaxID=2825586 RepID=A0A8S5QA15_9CAUD|nr:MAG TPA: Photosystem II protein D1 [Siphoviridae sp. ctdmY20]
MIILRCNTKIYLRIVVYSVVLHLLHLFISSL